MNKTKTTQPKTPKEPQGRDTFQTPNYATDLIIPYIPKFVKTIWEPAAGQGKIVQRLEDAGYGVYATDIRFIWDMIDEQCNFIEHPYPISLDEYWKQLAIITNPPFSLRAEFVKRCLGFKIPWALLINADYSGQHIEWIKRGCEKIIPTRRIDYITPTGLSGASGHTSDFHSMWLTYGFNLGKTETFVELTLEAKKNNI